MTSLTLGPDFQNRASSMQRFRFQVAYKGTNYHGWQIQASDRTVQGELKKVLAQILDKSPSETTVIGAGRTDAGVHARHQVAHVDVYRDDRSALELRKGINGLTDPDIFVPRLERIDESFHARFSAGNKTYQYRCWNAGREHPLWHDLTWHVHGDLDFEAIEKAAEKLVGVHDFEAFRSADCQSETSVRQIHDIQIHRDGPFCEIEVEGSGFLKYMVRTIAGTLVAVGRRRLEPAIIPEMIETGKRKLGGMTAPGKGLILAHIDYPDYEWKEFTPKLGKIGRF